MLVARYLRCLFVFNRRHGIGILHLPDSRTLSKMRIPGAIVELFRGSRAGKLQVRFEPNQKQSKREYIDDDEGLHPVCTEIQAALFCTQAPRTDQPISARHYPI